MKAIAILVLTVSTLFIWVASSPMSLDASALTPSAQVVASKASPVQSQQGTADSDHVPLTAPVALLLQGLVFLACGSLWPRKSEPSTSAAGNAVVIREVEHLRN